MKPVFSDQFYHDGRGPELQRVHWRDRGQVLRAIDYYLPDASYEPDQLRHVLFGGVQVVMITPEEVIGYGRSGEGLVEHRPAALFDLGRSDWLLSFAQRHLDRCRHFQLYFYDELFDVICEEVNCRRGGYSGEPSDPAPEQGAAGDVRPGIAPE